LAGSSRYASSAIEHLRTRSHRSPQVFLWGFLFLLAARPSQGSDRREVLWKEDVYRQYDGTLYYEIEERRKTGERLPWYRGGKWFGVI
jgi:hypothetical protein